MEQLTISLSSYPFALQNHLSRFQFSGMSFKAASIPRKAFAPSSDFLTSGYLFPSAVFPLGGSWMSYFTAELGTSPFVQGEAAMGKTRSTILGFSKFHPNWP